MRWTYSIVKWMATILGLFCFLSALLFGSYDLQYRDCNLKEKESHELRDGAKKERPKKKKIVARI